MEKYLCERWIPVSCTDEIVRPNYRQRHTHLCPRASTKTAQSTRPFRSTKPAQFSYSRYEETIFSWRFKDCSFYRVSRPPSWIRDYVTSHPGLRLDPSKRSFVPSILLSPAFHLPALPFCSFFLPSSPHSSSFNEGR